MNMKKIFYPILLFACVILMGSEGLAQTSLAWTNLGPDNLGSRTRAVTFDANGNVIAGSVGGGLWRSTNKGVSWSPITSFNSSSSSNLNITSIATSGATMYVATGETEFFEGKLHSNALFDVLTSERGYIGYSGLPGEGIFVSSDNGETWSNANAANPSSNEVFSGIQKVHVDASSGRMFVATREGLYWSDDQLTTVSKSDGPAGFTDAAVFDVESNGQTIYAGNQDSLYLSTDGGATFVGINDRIPLDLAPAGKLSDGVRVEIAVSPSSPNIAYVAGAAANQNLSGIWRTDDNGATWTQYAPSENAGFTPLVGGGRSSFTLQVYPDNPNEVIIAGGAWYTFTEAEGWIQSAQHSFAGTNTYIPTNIYTVAFDPNNNETFYIGTDKQITVTHDRGATFSQKSKGYEAGLTYSVTAIPLTGTEAVLAGTPENGTIYNGTAFVSSAEPQSIAAQGFGQVSSTSGGRVGASYIYPGATVVQGNDEGILRSGVAANPYEVFYGFPVSPQLEGIQGIDTIIDRVDNFQDLATPTVNQINDDGADLPVVQWVIDEYFPDYFIDNDTYNNKDSIQTNDSYIVFCSKNYVWLVNYPFGNPDGLLPRWNKISNRIPTGSTESFTALTVTGDESHTVFVGTSEGKLYRISRPHEFSTFDAATNIIRLDDSGNLPEGQWISSLSIDPNNSNRLIVTYAGYGNTSDQTLVYITDDALGLPAFTPVLPGTFAGLPIYASKLIDDPATPGESILLLGTEKGLYKGANLVFPNPAFAQYTWSQEADFPSAPIYDIHVQKYKATIIDEETQDFQLSRDNTVFVGTYGAGVYATTSLTSGREGETPTEIEIEETAVSLYPNPTEGMSHIQVELPESADVQVEVFGLDGRKVRSLASDRFDTGVHTFDFDTAELGAGMYLVKVLVKGETTTFAKTLKSIVVQK